VLVVYKKIGLLISSNITLTHFDSFVYRRARSWSILVTQQSRSKSIYSHYQYPIVHHLQIVPFERASNSAQKMTVYIIDEDAFLTVKNKKKRFCKKMKGVHSVILIHFSKTHKMSPYFYNVFFNQFGAFFGLKPVVENNFFTVVG
jgi:hypothetical protein